MDAAVQNYYKWYEKNFSEIINLDKLIKGVTKSDHKWLVNPLKNFYYIHSSIWRFDAFETLKYQVTPKKSEYICAVFKITRRKRIEKTNVQYHTNYAYLYSYIDPKKIDLSLKKAKTDKQSEDAIKKLVDHEYVCTSPTFKSADGEYRPRFIRFSQLEEMDKTFSKELVEVEDFIIKEAAAGEFLLQVTVFFPDYIRNHISYDRIKKSYIDLLDCKRMPILLYKSAWIVELDKIYNGLVENHLADGYHDSMFSYKDKKFFNSWREKHGDDRIDYEIAARVDKFEKYPNRPSSDIQTMCGQKFLLLRIKEIEEPGNIKHSSWRELYIMDIVGDLVINGITPGVPILSSWFFIQENDAEMYDNKASQVKLSHSHIAKEIVKKLERSRRGTYTLNPKDKKELYISYKMEGLSENIEMPMDYAEKEIIMSNTTLVYLVEHLGRTFADQPVLDKIPWYARETGPIFDDYFTFSKYLFEYIYGLYVLNCKQYIIHGDLHLNNITLHRTTGYYKDYLKGEGNPTPEAHIIFDISPENKHFENEDDLYIMRHYGRNSCIIDFSRGFIGRPQLEKDFPEHKVSEFIAHERRRMLRTWRKEMPDFANANKDKIEAALLRNFDLVFKIFTASDTFKLSLGMKVYLLSRGVRVGQEILDLLDKVNEASHKILTLNMQKVFDQTITDVSEIEWPNYSIIKECFDHLKLKNFKPEMDKGSAKIQIVDIFSSANTLNYNTRNYDDFPPQSKFDYIIEHKITQEIYGMNNYKDYQKYISREPLEAKVEKISKAMRESKKERRGYPEDFSDTADASAVDAPAVETIESSGFVGVEFITSNKLS